MSERIVVPKKGKYMTTYDIVNRIKAHLIVYESFYLLFENTKILCKTMKRIQDIEKNEREKK